MSYKSESSPDVAAGFGGSWPAPIRIAAFSLLVFGLFLGVTWLGYHSFFEPEHVAAFWPASGLLLGLFCLTRYRYWLLIGVIDVAAELAFSRLIGDPYPWYKIALLAVVANSEAVLGAFLLRRIVGLGIDLSKQRHLTAFILVALLATVLGAVIGGWVTSFDLPQESFYYAFQVWWFADMLGVLLVAPFIFSWGTVVRDRGLVPGVRRVVQGHGLESAFLFGGLLIAVHLVFSAQPAPIQSIMRQPFVVLLPLLWLAVRMRPPLVSTASLMIGILVVDYTRRGLGPIVGHANSVSALVLMVQAFLSFAAIAALLLSSAMAHRRRAEYSLRKSEETALALLNATHDSALLIDPTNWSIMAANDIAARKYKRRVDEIVGCRFEDIMPPAVAQSRQEEGEQVVRTREPVYFEDERQGMRFDNRMFPVFDAQGNVIRIAVFARDITERARAEAELRELQEKLAHTARVTTMGEMATGIAHELNQPLAAIVSYAYVMRGHTENLSPPNCEMLDVLEKLEGQAIRAGEIVRRLREFVKQSAAIRVQVDLNALVRDVAQFVEPDVRRSETQLVLHCEGPVVQVLIDEIQIQQVLVNLIRNASDAMLETPADERRVTVATHVRENGEAVVTVSDLGRGLDGDDFDKVFNAFFSTKQGGMGMGLPISRSIVEAHGGRLWAEPNVDRGVTFGFSLPLHADSAAHGQSRRAAS